MLDNIEELLISEDLNVVKEYIKQIAIKERVNYLLNESNIIELLEGFVNDVRHTILPNSVNDILDWNFRDYFINKKILDIDLTYEEKYKIISNLTKEDAYSAFKFLSADLNNLDNKSIILLIKQSDYLKDGSEYLSSISFTDKLKILKKISPAEWKSIPSDYKTNLLLSFKDDLNDIPFLNVILNSYNHIDEIPNFVHENIKKIGEIANPELAKQLLNDITKNNENWGYISATFYTSASGLVIILITTMLLMLYGKGKETIGFIYFKLTCDKIFKYIKTDSFFISRNADTKMLEFELYFQKCADYKRFSTPYKTLIDSEEAFRLKNCLIKYACCNFLYITKVYKDYLKNFGIQLSNIRKPEDLLNIKHEKIKVTLRQTLLDLYKYIIQFLDDANKAKLILLFGLIIQDSFDMSRFKFDDFK